MLSDNIPTPCELNNKPLVEAIFELHWELEQSPNLPPHDPGFRIALGRYYDHVREKYPKIIDLPSARVPEELTANVVRHQFRRDFDRWPLSQLGPGILTVNETQDYKWDTFKKHIQIAIHAIYESYPSDIHLFKPVEVKLRYINAVLYDREKTDPITFLDKYLHTKVSIDYDLFGDFEKDNVPSGLMLNLTIPLSNPKGVGIINFANGYQEDKPAIIFETTISSKENDTPNKEKDFDGWISSAHEIAEKWFFTLCKGELLESFREKNG